MGVGCCGHHVAVRYGAGMHSSCHKACDVSHIRQKVGTHFICDGAERREINRARVCGIAANDQLRLVLYSKLTDRSHVKTLGVPVNSVLNDVEPFPADIDGRTMGEMSSMGEVPH